MDKQSDATTLSREASWLPTQQERRTYVVETLKHQAEASQQEFDVMTIYQCEEVPELFDEENTRTDRGDDREIAENLLKVNVDKVWELGFTGQGVLIAMIDTGVDYHR